MLMKKPLTLTNIHYVVEIVHMIKIKLASKH